MQYRAAVFLPPKTAFSAGLRGDFMGPAEVNHAGPKVLRSKTLVSAAVRPAVRGPGGAGN